jgi:hypothetical protein
MFKEVRTQVSLVTMSLLLPENCCSTSLFTTGYKGLAEVGHMGFFDGDFDWLLLAVFLHQSSFLH